MGSQFPNIQRERNSLTPATIFSTFTTDPTLTSSLHKFHTSKPNPITSLMWKAILQFLSDLIQLIIFSKIRKSHKEVLCRRKPQLCRQRKRESERDPVNSVKKKHFSCQTTGWTNSKVILWVHSHYAGWEGIGQRVTTFPVRGKKQPTLSSSYPYSVGVWNCVLITNRMRIYNHRRLSVCFSVICLFSLENERSFVVSDYKINTFILKIR
jgi:hypothetical protein